MDSYKWTDENTGIRCEAINEPMLEGEEPDAEMVEIRDREILRLAAENEDLRARVEKINSVLGHVAIIEQDRNDALARVEKAERELAEANEALRQAHHLSYVEDDPIEIKLWRESAAVRRALGEE